MKKLCTTMVAWTIAILACWPALAQTQGHWQSKDVLIKLQVPLNQASFLHHLHLDVEEVQQMPMPHWVRVVFKEQKTANSDLWQHPDIAYAQPNYPVHLLNMPGLQSLKQKLLAQKGLSAWQQRSSAPAPTDNPPLPSPESGPSRGADPLISHQWGMADIGAQRTLEQQQNAAEIVVAVIDTGVDYTHEDLRENLWRNRGELGTDTAGKDRATNGIDDDANGFIDDVVGWDFASKDNRPFDLSLSPMDVLLKGGNPGHGTHCAGNVGARGDNGKGIAGVAGRVRIMAIRFLNEKGSGTTADAVDSINYAVRNGARILSNSWGSEGEDAGEQQQNLALRESIQKAQERGVLFIAAAGNGHQGRGYDNDSDSRPAYPATYPHENIISVAALNAQNQLGPFSNWGARSVDLGAPGVKIYSTVPNNNYTDTVVNLFGMNVTWDGTSMATPHVAGAAALYWSLHPEKTWQEVKAALMRSIRPIPSLQGKTVSGGKLSVEQLLQM